jgi:ABC-type oligopeptide transport system substrate-binding subunit
VNKGLVNFSLKALLLFFCAVGNYHIEAQEKMNSHSVSPLNVFLGPIPKSIDPSSVTSFTEFVIIQQLARGLVHIDSDGQVAGDLAEIWKIEGNSTRFIFKLKENLRFSNGEAITSKNVVGSLMRQMKKGRTIHYDFSNIVSVKEINDRELEFVLKKADHLFINSLSYPEFSVLHPSDYSRPLNKSCEWKITSGYTTLYYHDLEKITLRHSEPSGRLINLISHLDLSKASGKMGLDFFVGIPPLSEEDHKKTLLDYETYSPRLSFTYFISVGKKSQLIGDFKRRIDVFSRLYLFRDRLKFSSPFHSIADQLFLPDGPGRTRSERVFEIKANHLKSGKASNEKEKFSKNLRILVQKNFPYSHDLVGFLESQGYKVKVFIYNNFDDFDVIRNSQEIDLIQTNNDFSSADLTSNLMVTLNPERPLIEFINNEFIKKAVRKLVNIADDKERIFLIQKVEEQLLLDALVMPIFYFNMNFYVAKERDSSSLSRRFPEVALWKIK